MKGAEFALGALLMLVAVIVTDLTSAFWIERAVTCWVGK